MPHPLPDGGHLGGQRLSRENLMGGPQVDYCDLDLAGVMYPPTLSPPDEGGAGGAGGSLRVSQGR